MSDRIHSHRDLVVYQKSFSAGRRVFELSKGFPREEMYSLTDQLRRSSRSVSANIAEAWRKRRYQKHFCSTLNIAEAEAAESQVWIDYAAAHGYLDARVAEQANAFYDEIIRMLVAMISSPEKWCIAAVGKDKESGRQGEKQRRSGGDKESGGSGVREIGPPYSTAPCIDQSNYSLGLSHSRLPLSPLPLSHSPTLPTPTLPLSPLPLSLPATGGHMLKLIIRFCVNEPWLVVLLAIAVSVAGWFSYQSVPIDAIPNVGENQVIVLTPWPGRSPKDIEDQVTYPLSVSLLAVPGAESVRGKSMFGYSFVQVTFKDEIDFYWARSRVSEQLGQPPRNCPTDVTPQLGPDATGLGQIYYYTLQPPKEGMGLAELRSMQDFVVKYELQAVEGVSEVASIGGYVRQYQIEVDPDKLRYHDISLDSLVTAIKGSNLDVGAKTVETTGMEYIVRGKGFLGSDGDTETAIRDIEDTVIMQRDGVPVRVSDVASVQIGPDFRRGALDYNGAEAVGGVVVMRYGENPRVVIDRVKAKIAQIEPALKGVKIHGVYDRSGLDRRNDRDADDGACATKS